MKCVMVPVILFFLVAAVPAQITSLKFTSAQVSESNPSEQTLQYTPADTFSLEQADIPFQISPIRMLDDSLIQEEQPFTFTYLADQTKKINLKNSMLLTSVFANWTSFYFRGKADAYYEKYQKAGNKKSINSYYNKTGTFDNYATAALVISGVTLTAYLYLLFTE